MELLTKDYRRPAAAGNQRRPATVVDACRQTLAFLDRSQWWSGDRLRDFQFRLLRPLLVHAFETVPCYRKRFEEAGLTPAEVTPENWLRVPILTRDSLQAEPPLSQRPPQAHGRLYSTETSGATGQPVKVVCTGHSQFFFKTLGVRDHLWHRRDLTRTHATIRHYPGKEIPPEGITVPQWCEIGGPILGRGPLTTISILNPIGHQLQWLERVNPAYLLTYPSNLKALIERSVETGSRLPALREVRTISETVTPELRALCRESWGVPLHDIYSSQELGYMALQCPEHDHYHVQSESVLLEVLDDAGRPCRPGEIGRVVVTALRNYAMPLIRYQIRDYAEAGEPCPCGRGLPTVRRFVGRQRNMLIMPSGEQRWPVFSWPRYKEVAAIRQFQFTQHSVDTIEMRLVSDRPLTDDQKERLTAIIHSSLGHSFNLVMTRVDEIPQGKNGKFEEFVSLIAG